MLGPLNFEMGGESYQLLPHTGFQALDLDRKVSALFGRLAARVSVEAEPGTPAFSASFFAALGEALEAYTPSEYRWLVETTLSRVTVTTPGKKNFALSTADAAAEHFAGRYAELYNVLFRVWELDRLSPFGAAREAEEAGS